MGICNGLFYRDKDAVYSFTVMLSPSASLWVRVLPLAFTRALPGLRAVRV